ncbi:porin Gram-negative type [Ferrimonas balearica DSM 9799]|uniref:Porin Gram-negative type n=1 Tax=Ferrimonas balearica (strain DSM 9799 / CCM 4581 / KCTC 23876 / PAT) TaxID=550540 RepID=E1SV34_FERBD|nr:porin [Ferrimonas balearica]ADN77334.1 porin Gram-negative type [Ferrimonas balearica DSM 9799]MBW3164702.1 porin [Ferrimonas balearica]MBY5980436.1 porin [Ferrimonas balearica]MBY6107218.1 porin [Ferrimonas balearica]MBY6224228.1 porin [Ferrimonas balearica]
MKKSILFLSVAAAMAMPAQAVELYNDGVNQITLGGHLTAQLSNVDWYQGVDVDTQLRPNSPRINFGFNRDLGNGYALDAKIETGYNMMTSGNSFSTRLGYMGVSHEDYGRLSFGKEWSTYYDAAWWTDMPVVFSSDQLGIYTGDTDGGDSGMGRADKAIQYRKGFSLGDFGNLNLGLQWQGENGALDQRIGGSLIYQIGEFKLGTSYVGGDINGEYKIYGNTVVDSTKHDAELTSWQVSAAYGQWGKDLYLAASYQQGTNTEAGMRFTGDSIGMEFLAAYGFETNTTAFVSYRQLESDGKVEMAYTDDERPGFADNGDGEWNESFVSFGVHQNLTSNTLLFAEYNISTGDDRDGDNQYAVGFRFFL